MQSTDSLDDLDLDAPHLLEDSDKAPLLYHYTDAAGFFGILENGRRLRATHHRYLNDRTEVSFGLELANEVIDELEADLGPAVVETLREELNELRLGNSFISCLSESQDVLSQWRAYAADGHGYCLGFRPDQRYFCASNEDGEAVVIHLVRCRYGAEAPKADLTAEVRRRLQRRKNRIDPISALLSADLAYLLWRFAHTTKHQHFAEEQEWRFIVQAPESETCFTHGRRGIVPYLQTEQLPLEEVWVGPNVAPDPEVAKQTTRLLLQSHNVAAKVNVWASPYKSC
jgi:hypothetical protein